jgi:hypothetical protein
VTPPINRWRSFVNFYFDVGRKPTWRHLLIRDDPTGEFGPGNAGWRVAARYRWRRPTARSRWGHAERLDPDQRCRSTAEENCEHGKPAFHHRSGRDCDFSI